MPQFSVGTSPVQLLGMNCRRKSIGFKNNSAAGIQICIDSMLPSGLTITNAGIVLDPGESYYLSMSVDGPDIQQPWSAVASAPGGVLVVKEYNDTGAV